MDFFSAIRVMLRRWHIVLSALMISVALAYGVALSIAPTYQAHGSALLVGAAAAVPAGSEAGSAQNPYTRLDSSTAVLTKVASQIMDDVRIRESLVAEGATRDFQVGQASDGTPVFVVVATHREASVALATVDLVLARLNEELDDRQAAAGAPPESRVRSIVITQPADANELIGGRIRAFLAVVALGVAASASLAFLADAIAQGRQRHAQHEMSGGDDPVETGPRGTPSPAPPQPRGSEIVRVPADER